MQQIALFLEQFKNIGIGNILLKEAVIEAVQKYLGIKLEKTDITLRQNNIYITLPPTGKSELFMKRTLITEYIFQKIGNKRNHKLM